jgi:hypothetical protein
MRLTVLMLSIAVLIGAPAAAQDSRELELARQVVELSELDRPMIHMIETMGPLVTEPLRADGNFSEEEIARFEEIFIEEFMAQMPAIRELLANTFARRFSESDLEHVIEFLSSPVGRRWVEMQTELMQEVEAEAMSLGEVVGQRTAARFQAYLEERANP